MGMNPPALGAWLRKRECIPYNNEPALILVKFCNTYKHYVVEKKKLFKLKKLKVKWTFIYI